MMAARSLQDNGYTPVMRPDERMPLRNLSIDQQLVLSATKPMSTALRQKGDPVPAEELPRRPSLRDTSVAVASLADKENVAAVDDESVFREGPPDPLAAEAIDGEPEPRPGTGCGAGPTRSEDVAAAVANTDTAYTQAPGASTGSSSDGSIGHVTPTVAVDSTSELRADDRIGDVTFKSFLCSGVELEIPDDSVTTEETLPPLTGSAADVSGGCSFQDGLGGRRSISQNLDLDSSHGREDHAYCVPARDDYWSRDELLPVDASATELKGPPDSLDPAGRALVWNSECLEAMQCSSSSHLLREKSTRSSSAVEHKTTSQSVSTEQSQDEAEKSVTADQLQDKVEKSVPADPLLDMAENGVPADQSRSVAEKVLGAGQLLDAAEKSALADQSQNTAEKSGSVDQSQNIAEKSGTVDQSQIAVVTTVSCDQSRSIAEEVLGAGQLLDTVEKGAPADQSQNTAEKSGTVDQSQIAVVTTLSCDQSQSIAEKVLGAGQLLDTAEKSALADQSQNTAEKSGSVDQSQNIAEKSGTVDQSQIDVVPTLSCDQSQSIAEEVLGAGQLLDTADKSALADQSQNTAEKSGSVDQSQNIAEKSGTVDQSQNTAEKSGTVDQSQNIAEKSGTVDQSQIFGVPKVPGDRVECNVCETPGHPPRSGFYFSLSRAETGFPAWARTSSYLREPFPWEPAISPSGPREDPLWADNLESPMPLPRFSSTFIRSILSSAIRTPQSLNPKSRVLRPPSEGGAHPQQGPRRTPGYLAGSQMGPQLENLGPQTPGHLTDVQTGQLREDMGPQTPGHLTDVQTGQLREDMGPQTPGHLTDFQTGPHHENLEPKTPCNPTGTQTGLCQENTGPQVLGDLAGTPLGPLLENMEAEALGELAHVQPGSLPATLRHIGELFLRVSQDMVVPAATAAVAVERHSVAAGTSPVPLAEHGVNTSGLFERKREFSVADASTATDTDGLLWHLGPEAVAALSRRDLEQRLSFTLIMVEALTQQLAATQVHRGHAPPPSDFRDRLVQTDHTELSQDTVFRELYARAQERIRALEFEQEQQDHVLQELRTSSGALNALGVETERALSTVNEMGTLAREDQASISEQMRQTRALYGRFREAMRRSEERTQRCEREKLLAEQQREEALRTKEASLAVLELLRSRHAAQVAELEESVGSHLELLPALSKAYQEQVSLNEEYVESLNAADELLRDTLSDQSRLSSEMSKAQTLLRQTGPVLRKLTQRAAAAVQARDQQEHEANRMRDELEQTAACLQDAQREIGDLKLQVTVLTTEVTVLRQRLSEAEGALAQAEIRSTELSATLSSTEASHASLLQEHSAQTFRLQEAQEKSSRLHELQAQHSAACETIEFLQMESQMAREEAAQSGALVKSHLQALRERNLECEDLKQELSALRLLRDALQEEVVSTEEGARSLLLEMGNKLKLASTDVTLLHHKVYTLTSALNTALNAALSTQTPAGSCKERAPPSHTAPPRHSARSFVDSIMEAATTEETQTSETDECPSAALGSGNSAFTRVPTTTPKKCEKGGDVQELLGGLGDAVSQLVCTVDRLRELRDRQCEELQSAASRLQGELESQAAAHGSRVEDLSEEVGRLRAQVERDAAALQQKGLEERTLRKLCSDLDESRELLQQHKTENKELCRELSTLRSSLQQAQAEAQVLRGELSGGQSAERLPALEERVQLQREVDKLRKTLSDTEDSRSKLLERAKRHKDVLEGNCLSLQRELQCLDQTLEFVKRTLSSIPEVVQKSEPLQKLVAYIG